MIGFLVTTFAMALSLLVVDLSIPGVDIATFPSALLAAISVGVVNSFIRPVLYILSLPLNILTLGLFSLIVNGVCFWLASLLVPGFSVHGLLAIIFGPILLSIANSFLGQYFAGKEPQPGAGTQT